MASAAEQLASNINFGAIAKAEELKKRIWFTLGALLVYRLGTYIPLPGINIDALNDIFKQQRSIVWKSIRVTRIYDQPNNSLIYVAHARELQLGSGKMSMSVVPLNGQQVTWTNGQPGAK